MELSDLPDEIIENICSHMNDEDLISYMRTSKDNYNACYNEWRRRHNIRYSISNKEHRFLTPEQRQKIRNCIKLTIKQLITIDPLLYIGQILTPREDMTQELQRNLIQIFLQTSNEIRMSRLSLGIDGFIREKYNIADRAANTISNMDLHSDLSLIQLATIIDNASILAGISSKCASI